MNFKRILSSALVVIMLFASIAVLVPIKAQAAHHDYVSDEKYNTDQVARIVKNYLSGKDAQGQPLYTSAEHMFQSDLAAGYLDWSTTGTYTIYVNRYTGVMYYRNELTGEMLTSNSYDFNGLGESDYSLSSQIVIEYVEASNSTKELTPYYSSFQAAMKNQISVTKIKGGLRVSYAIGETATRCLLPGQIEAHEFENDILRPMYELLYFKMLEYFGEDFALNYFEDFYNEEEVYKEKYVHQKSFRAFKDAYNKTLKEYKATFKGGIPTEKNREIAEVDNIWVAIDQVFNAYKAYNPNAEKFDYVEGDTPEKTLEGYAIYKIINDDFGDMARYAKHVKKYCTDYTFEMMYEDEDFCNYEYPVEPKPVFRCALEYTFNDDGSLSVKLPSNSIVFDETVYILKSITPLQYFGAANFKANDGYIFLPDGSGSVIQFEDFRNSNMSFPTALTFYGNDFCYSKITGAHSQPLTMPVYGMVSTKTVGEGSDAIRVSNGYFAILEEGDSMAALNITYFAGSSPEGSVFTKFTPYPTDEFDLSDTISVGNAKSYVKVSESKYTGSYVTRYVMLSDTAVYGKGESARTYPASYIGMAEYYRGYLEANGTLTALTNVSDDLPLYIEALGSIEVVQKILTFPVNVSKAITKFEDVVTMYEELGEAKNKLREKAKEYDKMAAAEDDNLELKHYYEQTAEDYRRLAEEIYDIDNINFKLTGFSNGGLEATYPTRVRWERVLGGKRGFKKLLATADDKTDADSTFGVYPDFDFQYINKTSLFDGVGKRNTVSRMVDNRYASKQVYSSITREFDTVYAMIVSADSLDRLYNKFIKRYSKYDDAMGISVSTLGSDLNSNFDKDNPVSRDEAKGYVTALLDRIANESDYSVMISQGNIYAVKYADHILDVCTDSSYYRYSSYTVPFIGMILHGYVNYTGAALNYSGSPDYDILRSIENGAAPYYVLGYQNTEFMKDDEELNKYYSVSYENWFDDIVEKYAILNSAIGDLQDYKIVGHEILTGERVIDAKEQVANLEALKAEFVAEFRNALQSAIDAKLVELRESNNYNARITVSADLDALVANAHEMFELDSDEQLPESFKQALQGVIDEFKREYDITGVDSANVVTVTIDEEQFTYTSKYHYVTGSYAQDGKNYVATDYTVNNELIVMVTYKHDDGRTRSFILNYNIYAVEVTFADGQTYVIDKYSFEIKN